jgi:DNA-binding FrmR family transcriptional regulator
LDMIVENPTAKDEMNRRLNRIEGQLRGVQKMIDEGRECREVLQQLVAIRAAVQGASLLYLETAARQCLSDPNQAGAAGQAALISELVTLVGKVSG